MHPFSDLSGVCQKKGVCHWRQTQPLLRRFGDWCMPYYSHTLPQAWFGRCCCWKVLKKHLFVCWSAAMKLYTFCQCVVLPLGTYSTKLCLSLKKIYSMYSLWMFPHCLSVASEVQLRTRKGCMQLITTHDKKDHDGKINGLYSHRYMLHSQIRSPWNSNND